MRLKGLAALGFCALLAASTQKSAVALELDWSGQFWSEVHFIHNYELDNSPTANSVDPVRVAGGGYYIPGGGDNDAGIKTLFMRLNPKIIVNDNIYLKSEFWLGNPTYGFLGGNAPGNFGETSVWSTQNAGSFITAQRYWAEFLSDIGTVQVGRAPLDWGLGVMWNSGDKLWDRYQSTGDVIRMISKFGAFSFIPGVIYYSLGDAVGGVCTPGALTSGGIASCAPLGSDGSLTDYSLILNYESPEQDFDLGINFFKRVAGGAQTTYLGPNGTAAGMNFNVFDLYGKKNFGKITFSAELPIISGSLGLADYNTAALATELNWKTSDTWETNFKLGYAPGQPNSPTNSIGSFKALAFNPNYHLGQIMFNYQPAYFSGPNANGNVNPANLASPWYNPILDAEYAMFQELLHADKWTFNANFIIANAPQAASTGLFFLNNTTQAIASSSPTTITPIAATSNQSSFLGWEMDYGAQFQWDENFIFRLNVGLYFPGQFYAFSNVVNDPNATSALFATSAQLGVTF